MNTYEWRIDALHAALEAEGLENVVRTVFYSVVGTEGTNPSITFTYGGLSVDVPQPDPDAPFVPYEDLTEEETVSWVQAAYSEEALAFLYATIDERLEVLKTPPSVPLPLPWTDV